VSLSRESEAVRRIFNDLWFVYHGENCASCGHRTDAGWCAVQSRTVADNHHCPGYRRIEL